MDKNQFEQLEAGLQIDRDNLDEALLMQPDLYHRVADALELVISQRDAAKQALAETEAVVDQELREAARLDNIKVTETEIASQKIIHPKVKKAREVESALKLKQGRLSALKESYQQRSYALKELVELYTTRYFGDSISEGSASAHIREQATKSVRREMNQLRRERM